MITLRNVTLRRGVKVVLRAADLTLHPGEKIGLIGRNGAGKSSLFLLLTGRLHAPPEAGALVVALPLMADSCGEPTNSIDLTPVLLPSVIVKTRSTRLFGCSMISGVTRTS